MNRNFFIRHVFLALEVMKAYDSMNNTRCYTVTLRIEIQLRSHGFVFFKPKNGTAVNYCSVDYYLTEYSSLS